VETQTHFAHRIIALVQRLRYWALGQLGRKLPDGSWSILHAETITTGALGKPHSRHATANNPERESGPRRITALREQIYEDHLQYEYSRNAHRSAEYRKGELSRARTPPNKSSHQNLVARFRTVSRDDFGSRPGIDCIEQLPAKPGPAGLHKSVPESSPSSPEVR
jgi:hypothetical protein